MDENLLDEEAEDFEQGPDYMMQAIQRNSCGVNSRQAHIEGGCEASNSQQVFQLGDIGGHDFEPLPEKRESLMVSESTFDHHNSDMSQTVLASTATAGLEKRRAATDGCNEDGL